MESIMDQINEIRRLLVGVEAGVKDYDYSRSKFAVEHVSDALKKLEVLIYDELK